MNVLFVPIGFLRTFEALGSARPDLPSPSESRRVFRRRRTRKEVPHPDVPGIPRRMVQWLIGIHRWTPKPP